MATVCITQNDLILKNLLSFYRTDGNFEKMLPIINGESSISLRIVDWFATNYSKQYSVTYETANCERFKVYTAYKLKLRSYSKKRFDPFCRWTRISIPYKEDKNILTTIGQLNFFKWALENDVIKYIQDNYEAIENDMNSRNSTSKQISTLKGNKTRKKREELSISAAKSIYMEDVMIVMKFD